MQHIYLDHAAATPVDERVVSAMSPYLTEHFYNPSALYSAAQDVRKAVEEARSVVAGVLSTRPAEIVFTAGATEGNNMAIHGVMTQYHDAQVAVSGLEHDSVLAAAERHSSGIIPVTEDGIVTPEAVRATVTDKTVLVSVMYANNEVGTIQPIRRIGQMLAEIRAERRKAGNSMPLYFHTDAAQAANYLDLQVSRLGVDLLTLNGGKIYGPKQSGVLYVRGGVTLKPLIVGGGQEAGLRSGTENVPAIIGLAQALQIASQMRMAETNRLQALQRHVFSRLADSLPDLIVTGSQKHRLPNNIHLIMPGRDNERLLFELDGRGIMAAAGSACSASSDLPSHVLKAMGYTDEYARSSLRLTTGRSTDQAAVDTLIAALIELARS